MIEMIKYNQLNHITAELLIILTCIGGCGIFENDGIQSDCMGDSVEYDRKDKSDVNV